MTDPIRGARPRRNRRPGWILMTVLLVLAIAASSALVFTNRVELLKLAVILALWAAVVAAFVSVVYRRQSDTDQAKVRDLKLVYDLQLDREISARREYELAVESQLRRELASELRAQSADEVGALRAELAALRANLEYLFDTDLTHRPALETDRARDFADWPPATEGATGRVRSSRSDPEDAAAPGVDEPDPNAPDTEESPIIDVPAEPQPAETFDGAAGEPGGAHRRAGDGGGRPPGRPEPPADPQFPWLPLGASTSSPPPAHVTPPRPAPALRPQPQPQWQPVQAEGQWIPPGRPGSNWVPSGEPEPADSDQYVGRRRAPDTPPPQPPPGRHSSGPDEQLAAAEAADDTDSVAHAGVHDDAAAGAHAEAAGSAHAEAAGGARDEAAGSAHDETAGGAHDETAGGAHAGGQSVADLLARFQATPGGGGRRRRRDG